MRAALLIGGLCAGIIAASCGLKSNPTKNDSGREAKEYDFRGDWALKKTAYYPYDDTTVHVDINEFKKIDEYSITTITRLFECSEIKKEDFFTTIAETTDFIDSEGNQLTKTRTMKIVGDQLVYTKTGPYEGNNEIRYYEKCQAAIPPETWPDSLCE
jgi:hypothetical protein